MNSVLVAKVVDVSIMAVYVELVQVNIATSNIAMRCGRLFVNVGSFIKCFIILQGTNAMQLSWKKQHNCHEKRQCRQTISAS